MRNLQRWVVVMIIVSIIYFLSDISDLQLIHDEQIPLWMRMMTAKYSLRIGGSGYFSYILSLHPDFILHKIGHIVAFGTLGLSIYWAARHSLAWAIALTGVAAALDEWHQSFVPGRSSRFGDVVLDNLAAILFILIAKFLTRKNQNPL